MKKHKKIIIFLLKFLGTYFLMVFLYVSYLNFTQKTAPDFKVDPITEMVAKQTVYLLNFLNINAFTDQHTAELSYRLFVKDKYVATIVEGCNAISVIILFIAFIIAFSATFKITLLYILVGSLLIYWINVVRIAFIAFAIYQFPTYNDFLHQILFPLIIYGFTFLLWVVWINFFLPKYKK